MRWKHALVFAALAAPASFGQPHSFEQDVLPILSARCAACHNPKTSTAGLDLHGMSVLLRGSQNGPVIEKGSAEKSLLFQRVNSGSMPPGKEKLTAAEIEVVRQWIDAGAPSQLAAAEPAPAASAAYRSKVTDKDRQFWAFRPLANPPVPSIPGAKPGLNPVDAFLLRKLQEKQLAFSKPAEKAILIRRAYLDLTGLPPSPEEVDAFLKDKSPAAYTALVDRLLATPEFGERWGRYWLDLAGYVDTVGRDVQAGTYSIGKSRWRYRDYVVDSFRQDKPYNQFLTEQIAGDELFDRNKGAEFTPAQRADLIATGFLRTAEDPTDNPERDTPLLRYEVVHQTLDILTSSVLGLTVGCARCHDHKFDPIPQRDYYRLMATLTPAYNPVKWTPVLERTLPDVPTERADEIRKFNAGLDEKLKALQASLDKIIDPLRAAAIDRLIVAVPEAERTSVRKAALMPEAKRNPRQKELAAKLGDLSPTAMAAQSAPEVREHVAALAKEIADLGSRRLHYEDLESLYDTGAAPETYIHRRGDFESKGADVGPGALEVLSENADDLEPQPAYPGDTGRRIALARFLTAEATPASALVSRVYVNRMWNHLFGQGIVTTTENFGVMGAKPTHPELLDWLAGEFQRNGWRTKPLLRTLMLSDAYRQSSLPSDSLGSAPLKADPENTLLWHMRMRRLDSEAIRDSMLSVSGKLNRKMGGPAIKTVALPDGMVLIDEKALKDPSDRYRRSLYLVARRRYSLSLMNVFDHPVMNTNATTRGASAVVLQSLMMLNDSDVLAQSRFFAERVQSQASDINARIALAYRYAVGRPPDDAELEWSSGLYARERDRFLHKPMAENEANLNALAAVCHVLFNANEFLYVE
ncbi:MAG: PSD1 and planctomycete cytochrome C domain-containing protein [Acidobacteriota bacterium]